MEAVYSFNRPPIHLARPFRSDAMLYYRNGVTLLAIGGSWILWLAACALAEPAQELRGAGDGAGDDWRSVEALDEATSDQFQERPFHFSFVTSYLYGPINGSLQIPSGGLPGTTSHDRPTLGELGI